MQDERFTVKYITVKNCFVYLPEQWLKKVLSRPNVVKVLHNEVNYYLSWYTRPSPDNARLCLGATFARTLNIKEGDEVFVFCLEEAPPLTSIVVAPKSSHDREIVEMQSENIQKNLLDQIQVVAKDQTIVFWVSKFMSITLIINSLDPDFMYGRLKTDTEIYVGNPIKKIPVVSNILDNFCESPEPLDVYRIHPLLISIDKEKLHLPFKAYAKLTNRGHEVIKFFKVCKIREDQSHINLSELKSKEIDTDSLVIEICPLGDLLINEDIDKNYYTNFAKHPCIYMSMDLMDSLHMKVGGKITLEPICASNKSNVECTSVEIYPRDKYISKEDFDNFISRHSQKNKILLNSHGLITLDNRKRCLIKLLPNNCSYGFFDETFLKKLKIKINDVSAEDNLALSEIQDAEILNKNIIIDVLQTIITECENTLTLSLGLHNIKLLKFEYDRENILIKGTTGSGKTTVCKLLQNIFSKSPYFTYTKIINCKFLKGKKADLIQKLLIAEISDAVYYQPSILFFDNIECITGASANTEEVTPDSMNATRITDTIYSIISEHQATNYISVVATCTDISKVGKKLRQARGVHFFRTILTISNLKQEERIKILRSSLEDKLQTTQEIDWDHYGNKTEGWVAQDLVVLADKAAFTAWKRHVKDRSKGQLTLLNSELLETLACCRPTSLDGVKLYRGPSYGWSHIGGLAEVKRALIEILHWPLKYPNIFNGAPIKLQSGVLLYGMPGTGKTLLAGAIAHECSLNMISVKGPELLSKYIGASEEAVRNLFEKAHRAKPCVLFFDEFDSLAPRRGHDSTGVTDRVVNQLLTHLDGIEDREGVAVVAASSRPDLLDPALLRPGRLDKSLLCPLPDANEREEILSALCRVHEIDTQGLDLQALASLTSDFTGADLNAVLMQARLNVIEEALVTSSDDLKNYCNKNITQKHLIESVDSTKPSLSRIEKQKYTRIYGKFAQSENYPINELKHQKATLA